MTEPVSLIERCPLLRGLFREVPVHQELVQKFPLSLSFYLRDPGASSIRSQSSDKESSQASKHHSNGDIYDVVHNVLVHIATYACIGTPAAEKREERGDES